MGSISAATARKEAREVRCANRPPFLTELIRRLLYDINNAKAIGCNSINAWAGFDEIMTREKAKTPPEQLGKLTLNPEFVVECVKDGLTSDNIGFKVKFNLKKKKLKIKW